MRARSLGRGSDRVATPFLDRLGARTLAFRRAYATECWTLPAHLSMFTGLLPSQHGAHFQTMGYRGEAPTLAELAGAAGYDTEVITRNSLFDGSVPGTTRGFNTNTRRLAPLPGHGRIFHLVLALAKPRVRRALRQSGFFTRQQRSRRDFIETVARMGIPNDRAALDHAVTRLQDGQRRGRPQFLFVNCYDVHAPYSPNETSPLQPWTSPLGMIENLRLSVALPKVSGHGYLKPGFRLSAANRRMLQRRYETAIGLMDEKLAAFWAAIEDARLLGDTVVVLTSDHGEAFGEHDLYFHDASVYDVHLHVPLWIHHPELAAGAVGDTVSTRDLFALLGAVMRGISLRETLADATYRQSHPVALAEHFHYPHVADALPRYRHNQTAAIAGSYAYAVRGTGASLYDLEADPYQSGDVPAAIEDFTAALQADGLCRTAIDAATRHLKTWQGTRASVAARGMS